MLEEKFLTAEEVAAMFRVSPRTVTRWAKEGRIPAIKIGKNWLFPASALKETFEKAALKAKKEEGQERGETRESGEHHDSTLDGPLESLSRQTTAGIPSGPEALRVLRELLDNCPPGKIASNLEDRVKELLAEVWDMFTGSEEAEMAPYKVTRAEQLQWGPPVLSFIIERHGGTVLGSTRAELQEWYINFETMEASYEEKGYRQLYPTAERWKAEPVAKEIAKLILENKEDPRIQWVGDNRVKILTSKIIPTSYRQTLIGRKRRFYRALDEILGPFGWKRAPNSNVYEKIEGKGGEASE